VTSIPTSSGSAAVMGAASYRADIDGLRAVAVLPVVAYHVGVHAARGGFVGVDVFFVISGFLISQLLINDIDQHRFSIVGFYERRVRRIMPALILVLAVTAAVYQTVSLPSETIEFSKSLIAAAASVSNIYFWLHAGYFDGSALTRPLLHTWSLAVEEQFYVLWPILLYLAARFWRTHVVSLTAGVACISLVMSVVGAFIYPVSTFYLLHTRAWELLLGGLLALGAIRFRFGRVARNALSLAGIVLIMLTVFTISSDLPFPGLLAIPPCVGAAMVIQAGRDGPSLVGRILSWRPLVFIGTISYSLYLWHWPIAVLQRGGYLTLVSGQSEKVQKLVIVTVSMLLAAISWRFVEQPFRSGPWRPSRRTLFAIAASGLAVIVAAGILGWSLDGFPGRYSAQELRIASYLNYDISRDYRSGSCFLVNRNQSQGFASHCLSLDPSRTNYLLVGDSHAADLWYGMKETFPGINFLQATAVDCYPTITHGLQEAAHCSNLMDELLQRFILEHRVDQVVLSARWTQAELPRLLATLIWLDQKGVGVTLIGPVEVYDGPLPRLLIAGMRANDPEFSNRHWDRESVRELDADMAALAQAGKANYVSILKALCPQTGCITVDGSGMPIYLDNEHFTGQGSIILARKLKALGLWAVSAELGRQ